MVANIMGLCVLLVVVFALTYAIFDNTQNYSKTIKRVFVVVEILVFAFAIGGFIVYENKDIQKKEEAFVRGERLICNDNNTHNIVVSKENGYELQREYLIKGERALELYSCKMIDDDKQKTQKATK